MSKDVIISSYGYYDMNLTIHNLVAKLNINTVFYDSERITEYHICFVRKGTVEFWCQNKTHTLNNGDIFIAKPYEKYKMKGTASDRLTEVMIISFYQGLFKNVRGDENYLRVFNDRKTGELNVYKKDCFKDFSIEQCVINTFQSYINRNLGLIHFISGLCTLITQLDLAYDNINLMPTSVNSDDYKVKVYDYICSNCMTNITAKDVCKKFNVSKWYLDKVTNQFYGLPFHKTIQSHRMWNSKGLMVYKNNLIEISKICGYSEYSTFYRNYSSFFGVSPKKDFDYFRKHREFLSDKNNGTITQS